MTAHSPSSNHPRPSVMAVAQARAEQARCRFEEFTAGPIATMRGEMAQPVARQSLSRAGALDTIRSEPRIIHVPSILSPIEEEKTHNGWQQDTPHVVSSQSLIRVIGGAGELGVVDEKKQSAISRISTVLNATEIAQLKLYHDSSLAASTRGKRIRAITIALSSFCVTASHGYRLRTCRGSAR